MPRKTIVFFALAACALLAGDAAALSPHVRDGWVLGLGFGGARGKATLNSLPNFDPEVPNAQGEYSGSTEDGVAPQVRFARMLGSHFSLGVAYSGWMYETVKPDHEAPPAIKWRFSLQSIMLAGTWYPGRAESGWGGLYIRGGAGLAWTAITEVELVPGEEQGHGERQQETGLGVEVVVGYEFRVVPNMSAGIGIGFNHQDIGGDLYEKSSFYPATLTLGWYWD